MSLLLYNLLLPFALLAMLPGALRKMRQRGGSWSDLRQRIGLFSQQQRAELELLRRHEHRYWFHAVSVGEVNVAVKLIAALLQRQPGSAVLLTTTTPTGHAIATTFAARHHGRVAVLYSPLDLPFVVRPMLEELRPRRLVLVEAEVWPNLVNQAHRAGIPVTLANARLSARSERRLRLAGFLTRRLFALLDQVLIQEPEDRARWAGLGVDPQRIHLTGSVKYDPAGQEVPAQTLQRFCSMLASLGIQPGERPIVLAASTHAGEERAIAETFLTLAADSGPIAPALLIVPRHVERAPAIVKELASLGLSPVLRSSLSLDAPASASFSPHRPLLIDTTGELNAWQHLSDIVIIGKSFLAHGGQNPAEAAQAGKPVVFGPHMENFEPLVKLLLGTGGAIQCPGLAALPAVLRGLLSSPQKAAQVGAAGRQALTAHAGAVHRTLDSLIEAPGPGSQLSRQS